MTQSQSAVGKSPQELASILLGASQVNVPKPAGISQAEARAAALDKQVTTFQQQQESIQQQLLATMSQGPTPPPVPDPHSKANMLAGVGSALGALFSRGNGLGGAYAAQGPARAAEQQQQFDNAETSYEKQATEQARKQVALDTAMRNAQTGEASALGLQEKYGKDVEAARENWYKDIARERVARQKAGDFRLNVAKYQESMKKDAGLLDLRWAHEDNVYAESAARNATSLTAAGIRAESAWNIAQLRGNYQMLAQTARDQGALTRLSQRDDDQSKMLAARLGDADFRALLSSAGKALAPLSNPAMPPEQRAAMAKQYEAQLQDPNSPLSRFQSEASRLGIGGDSVSAMMQAEIESSMPAATQIGPDGMPLPATGGTTVNNYIQAPQAAAAPASPVTLNMPPTNPYGTSSIGDVMNRWIKQNGGVAPAVGGEAAAAAAHAANAHAPAHAASQPAAEESLPPEIEQKMPVIVEDAHKHGWEPVAAQLAKHGATPAQIEMIHKRVTGGSPFLHPPKPPAPWLQAAPGPASRDSLGPFPP